MNNSNYIPVETRSIKLLYLIILIGLVGILMALLSMNMALFAVITAFPLICIAGILILRYPQLMLFIIFTINYFILGITRYMPIEGISIIMDILYVLTLVLIFVHSALYHSIKWKRCFHILSALSAIWTFYCILEVMNPSGVFEGWILSRGLIINGLTITILTSLLCTRYKTLKALLFTFSLFTVLAVLKTFMQKYFGFDTYETRWLNNGGATTHIIHSGIRYFSFFTDASNMGSNMGGAGIIFGITSLYMKNKAFKIYYASVAIASLYTMMLSGTRAVSYTHLTLPTTSRV